MQVLRSCKYKYFPKGYQTTAQSNNSRKTLSYQGKEKEKLNILASGLLNTFFFF